MATSTAETETHVWPTLEEITSALGALARGVHAIDELTSIYGGALLNVKQAPALKDGISPPSLEELGVLQTLARHVDLEAGVLPDFARQLKEAADVAALEIQPSPAAMTAEEA
jgi:hypothetical protein